MEIGVYTPFPDLPSLVPNFPAIIVVESAVVNYVIYLVVLSAGWDASAQASESGNLMSLAISPTVFWMIRGTSSGIFVVTFFEGELAEEAAAAVTAAVWLIISRSSSEKVLRDSEVVSASSLIWGV